MNKAILSFILAICISGCSLLNIKRPDVVITPKAVHLDQRIYELCADLVYIPGEASDNDILNTLVSNIEIYNDCRNKQEASVKLLKQFSNYKEPTK